MRKKKHDPLATKIDDLNLPYRALRALRTGGIRTVRDLIAHREYELKRLDDFGNKSLQDVKDALDTLGFKLAPWGLQSLEERLTAAQVEVRRAEIAYNSAVSRAQSLARKVQERYASKPEADQ